MPGEGVLNPINCLHIPVIVIYTLGTKKRGGPMEGHKSREELYNEACVLHKSLDEKLWTLQKKPFLTEDEEMEVKRLKKQKLHYKDIMESLKELIKQKG